MDKAPLSTATLNITGMTCAACAVRVEKVLARAPGVTVANVNFPLERADVRFDPNLASIASLQTAVADAGYRATAQQNGPPIRQGASSQDGWIALVAAFLSAPLVLQMIAHIVGVPFHFTPWIELALAAPVQFGLGARLYRGAFSALRHGAANMDVLVVLGTSTAFLYSLALVIGVGPDASGHLYFEASAIVTTFVLCGRWLETRAKRVTSGAVRGLLSLRPEIASVLYDGHERVVPIAEVRRGDLVVIRPGSRIPVDGEVVAGESKIDESAVTGESIPVLRSPGDRVIAGAMNGSGLLTVRTTAVGPETTFAAIVRLVESAQSGKAPLQKLVDKVSGIFVPIVVILAFCTFAGWWLAQAPGSQALTATVSVLVIACPCALGLAMPTAIVAGIGAAARAGILFKDATALEMAQRVDTVVFDKTGTLTVGAPDVVAYRSVTADTSRPLAFAAAVQHGSEHPLARAVVAEARRHNLEIPTATNFKAIPGQGASAAVAGQRVVIGNAALMTAQGIESSPLLTLLPAAAAAATHVFIAIDGKGAGVIALADSLRATSAAAVVALKARNIDCLILSGDTPAVVHAIASTLDIDDARGGLTPKDKADVISTLRKKGKIVAMIGDGINDAPALAAADLGVAIGSGTDVAIETADAALLRPDPRLVASALDIAARTHRIIRQNIFWAFIYNIIGLPIAAAGLLNPALAGAAMAASSLSVVLNALRLTRWRIQFEGAVR